MAAIRSDFGVGVFGHEDSKRGCFGFYFRDPAEANVLRDVSIHQLPQYAFAPNASIVNKIIQTYFEHGELDREFSWSLTVNCGGLTTSDTILLAGDHTPLEEFLERLQRARK